jgi:hypothetical protein
MAPPPDEHRRFKIEGSAIALRALADAIERALQDAPGATSRFGPRRASTRSFPVDVRVSGRSEGLRLLIDDRADWDTLAEGWAEAKHCTNCDKLVALLFEEEYIESHSDSGVLCSHCYGLAHDDQ